MIIRGRELIPISKYIDNIITCIRKREKKDDEREGINIKIDGYIHNDVYGNMHKGKEKEITKGRIKDN